MNVVILGGGESGVGTAILAKKKGLEVFVSDFGTITPHYQNILNEYGIDWEQSQHTEAIILMANLVMKSPGIPDKAPIVQKILAAHIPIVSEIEIAACYGKCLTIGITGSNGKTTTSMLTHHLLKEGQLSVGLAGNIGQSFAWQVAESNYENYVLELSSFQLDGIKNYKPHIAVITNISPDHLDRYNYDYSLYIASKFRITKNQTEEDYLIYDADDVAIAQYLEKNTIRAQKIPFSITKRLQKGAFLENNEIKLKLDKDEFMIPTTELSIEGKHNIKNAMAAATVANLLRIRKQTIRESLSNFQGVEHRLEKVLKLEGVQYINDSKATNVNAAFYALESMTTPTVWIVGGVDKGNDYDELMPLVREKVKAIICLGVDTAKIKTAFEDVVEFFVEAKSMQEAVVVAQQLSIKGDTVLLAPACASFDLFENYEDRGNQFKKEVRKL